MRRHTPSLSDLRKVRFAAALLLVCLLPATFLGQAAGSYGHPDTTRVIHSTAPNTGIVTFNVFAERNGTQLSRQALVKLVNLANQSVTWQTTGQDSQSVVTDIPYGRYDAEVSAVGYLSSHQELNVISIKNILEFDIVFAPRPGCHQPRRSRRRTIAEDAQRSQACRYGAQVRKLERRAKASRRGIKGGSFKLGCQFPPGIPVFQKKEFAEAETYLTTAVNLSPHNAQSLTLLGRTGWKGKSIRWRERRLSKR